MAAGMQKRFMAGGLLGGLILALLLTALTRTLPEPVDVTGFLQAESLRLDLDLTYDDRDFARLQERWPGRAPRLSLYRNAGGQLRYDRPALHAFMASPFAMLGPRGPLVLNVLLLALVAFLASRCFAVKLGWVGILLVTLFIFSSATFAYVFQSSPAILLLLSGAGSFGLIFGGELFARDPQSEEAELPRGPSVVWETLRWLLTGAFIGIAVAHHPFYVLLAIAAALCVPKEKGALGWPAMAAGALVVILALAFIQKDGGVWLGAAAPRGEVAAGSPAAIPASDLNQVTRASLEGLGARVELDLSKWNAIYFFAGRHVGLLVYFLPLVLAFVAGDGKDGRRFIILFSTLGTLAFVVFYPFDFAGGGFANVFFLPFYGALWFAVSRYSAGLFGLGVLALSAISIFPLWRSPLGPEQLQDGRYRHVSPYVSQYLPVETTQKNLFRGAPSLAGGLWVRQLSGAPAGVRELMLVGDLPGEVMIASPRPVRGLRLSFPGLQSDRIELAGAQPGAVSYSPDGGLVFGVELTTSARTHSMWWSESAFQVYSLGLRLPEASSDVHVFTLEVAE